MSADNGIYIAKFPKSDGTFEFRVAEAGASSMLSMPYQPEIEDAYRVLHFGDAPTFSDEKEAAFHAVSLAKTMYTEYGVCSIDMDRPLLNLSREEAYKVISQ
jgi:hypothetical protein